MGRMGISPQAQQRAAFIKSISFIRRPRSAEAKFHKKVVNHLINNSKIIMGLGNIKGLRKRLNDSASRIHPVLATDLKPVGDYIKDKAQTAQWYLEDAAEGLYDAAFRISKMKAARQAAFIFLGAAVPAYMMTQAGCGGSGDGGNGEEPKPPMQRLDATLDSPQKYNAIVGHKVDFNGTGYSNGEDIIESRIDYT